MSNDEQSKNVNPKEKNNGGAAKIIFPRKGELCLSAFASPFNIMYIPGGAVIWARQTFESDIFFQKPDKWFKIWFYIVGQTNHKNNKLFNRGSQFFTYKEISNITKATKHQIDHFLRWSKGVGMLATRKTTRGMVIKVIKYEVFQNLDNYKSDTESDLKAKQKRNKSDTINKNDKNDKNDKNIDSKPKGSLITDRDFIFSLKDNIAYKGIDIDIELSKMDAWLSTRPSREKTRRFIVNWLNKIDKPMENKKGGIQKWLQEKT